MSNETSALPADPSEPQQPQQSKEDQGPAIRIVPHIDGPRSLHFDIIEREVPEGVLIKIGRFTDKTQAPNRVTFKSKVVSRGHAEIWTEGGKFYIRDTKSSSGTFLNHVRLSPPSAESRPFELNDGDVVQLGVDYQGGTEARAQNQAFKKLGYLENTPLKELCNKVMDNPIDWEQLLAEHEEVAKKENDDPDINQNMDQVVDQSEQLEHENEIPNAGPSSSLSNIPPPNSSDSSPSQVNANEIDERLNSLSLATTSALTSKKSFAVPIPRNGKISNSSDDGDDQNITLSRTLPSSPPNLPVTIYIDENQHQSLREQGGAQRLDEIVEEDESSVGSSSPGKSQNPTTPLQESRCAAS
ncbi:19786_t:CDS:2 [Racocetra fulgida]|uniref:19786_t:CDS:1 n=1 Tax=Racocetra fulgida TaxID=60492 RepID=A0A9N9BYM4_9GLOM|nr:19786_t:CDS:2 [Racocetra fulgida]